MKLTAKENALNAPVKEQEFSGKTQNVVEVINPAGNGPFVLVCEHASNFIPEEYRNLGLGKKALNSHIAWDPGAIEIARSLSELLDAPLVASKVSRLIYDCNRPPTVKSAVAERSENYDIKGNTNLSKDKLDERAEKYYFPFRNALSECLGSHTRRVGSSIMVTIHTFTPVFQGRTRTIELGVLHDRDSRMADGLLRALAETGEKKVARNQPYGPRDGVTHTLKEHGSKRGIANVMIEIRNDLVANAEQQAEISSLLHSAITSAAGNLNARLG
ncbi:MAG: N-formylglutamate amidohydrolase [Rhizobiaceae bacterium]|nr:N-formylglutamate amidohydrolase [Rhizobiaceae bacterium]